MVDLIEGAPELTVMGGTGEQLERITLADRRLRATARQGAGTAGIGLGLTTALAGLAIVGVQFFGLSRGFFRYGERLVGHDAAFRVLADLRVRVYDRLEAIAPAGLPPLPPGRPRGTGGRRRGLAAGRRAAASSSPSRSPAWSGPARSP